MLLQKAQSKTRPIQSAELAKVRKEETQCKIAENLTDRRFFKFPLLCHL